MTKQTVTYCDNCGDGWSNEDFEFGVCCRQQLKNRPETDEEEEARESALARIIKRAEELDW